MFETIVVPVDGSPRSEAVLARAVALARRAGARVVALRCVAERDDAQGVERALQHLARSYQAAGAAVDTRLRYVRYDDHEVVARAICDVARHDRAGLVVMATRGPAPAARWYYGSVAEQVLRHADCPVLVLPPAADGKWDGASAARVLVPLDGSAPAEAVLGPAQELTGALGAELLLVGVVDSEAAPRAATDGYNESAADVEEALEETRGYLEHVAERLRPSGAHVHVRAAAGRPAEVVADLAHEPVPAIIAMSTHGRHCLEHLAPGEVATTILRTADVPLLLVRPTGMRDPLANNGPAASPAAPGLSVQLTPHELDLLVRALDELPYAPACTAASVDAALALREKLTLVRKAAR